MFDISSNKNDYLNALNEWADEHLMLITKEAKLSDGDKIIAIGRDVLPESIRLSRDRGE